MTKICLVNVGANSSHGKLRSALFSDGNFEFIPIPDPCLNGSQKGLKYSQLRASSGMTICQLISEDYHNQCAHNDPEFETYTYGDYPTCHARAANLKRLNKGDYIFFYARLVPWNRGKFNNKAKFCIIGFIEIYKIYKNITKRPSENEFREIANNAHVIRGEVNSFFYDGFWIFKGSPKSMRFNRAVTFNRLLITECGIKDAKGREIEWGRFSSELAAIGSYFRSSKLIVDNRQIDLLWDKVNSESY
jgi:hypothetical protein